MALGALLRAASTGTSTMLAALFLGGYVQPPPNATEIVQQTVAARGSIAEPACADADCATQCHWWDADAHRDSTDVQCTSLTMRRHMGRALTEEALDRATACARSHHVSCVLSHEIGYPLPAVMIWDASRGRMRMIMMPHARRLRNNATADRLRRVSVLPAPFNQSMGGYVDMYYGLTVEHVDRVSGDTIEEFLEGQDAFCVQSLLLSIPLECDLRVE